jgi:hypothetical protein
MARDRLKWLFESVDRNPDVMRFAATSTIVITGLDPVIHVLLATFE